MFTSVEVDYLKGLLNTYASRGYKYYVAHTVTETDNNYDMLVYLSKNEITSSRPNTFNIPDNSIVISIDSSSRNDNSYNPSVHSRDILGFYHGNLEVNIAEFIYTNSDVTYELTTNVINPDILMSASDSYNNKLIDYSLLFIVISIFIYMFIRSLLRLKR